MKEQHQSLSFRLGKGTCAVISKFQLKALAEKELTVIKIISQNHFLFACGHTDRMFTVRTECLEKKKKHFFCFEQAYFASATNVAHVANQENLINQKKMLPDHKYNAKVLRLLLPFELLLLISSRVCHTSW